MTPPNGKDNVEPKSIKFFTTQFRRTYLYLGADIPSLLATAQRSPSVKSTNAYLLYRFIAFLFWFCVWIASIASEGKHYLIFLTNWGVTLLMISTALQITTSFYRFHRIRKNEDIEEFEKTTPILYKINWVIYNIASTIAITVTIIYYATFDAIPTFYDILVHALNTVFVIGDAFWTGVPVRVLHLWHPVAFCIMYICITVLFWAATGKGIYHIIDYSENPDLSALSVVLILAVAIPLFHLLLFLVYWARVLLWGQLCGKSEAEENAERHRVTFGQNASAQRHKENDYEGKENTVYESSNGDVYQNGQSSIGQSALKRFDTEV